MPLPLGGTYRFGTGDQGWLAASTKSSPVMQSAALSENGDAAVSLRAYFANDTVKTWPLDVPSHKDLTTALCYIAHTAQFPRQRAMLDLKLEPPCADIGEASR